MNCDHKIQSSARFRCLRFNFTFKKRKSGDF